LRPKTPLKLFRGLQERPPYADGTVVAIGNFDGLHLGHQKILRILISRASEMDLSSLVLTFSPHPERVLARGRIGMIQTLQQRLAGIRGSGVDSVVVASFDRAFSALTAADFAGRVIASSLRARAVVVGENFRFGRSRQGDVDDLRRLGQKLGFTVSPVPSIIRNGEVVSSSLIRRLLREGKISAANNYLGRPYEIVGRVVSGSRRGRGLGFPTANVESFNEILPRGVYITLADILGRSHPSLTNLGHRPTFGGGALHVEVHIFDFDDALYRRRIGLRFLRKVRDERTFSDREGLIRQVQKDIAAARIFFKRGKTAARSAAQNTDD
jgi:riboflavin kinase/FMN adenylyltransferase